MNARKLFAIAGLVALVLAGATSAPAEEATRKLTLLTTLMKSSDDFQTLTDEPADGMTPTTITCPKTARSCTVRLELQSQFALLGLVGDQGAVASFAVDGFQSGITPFAARAYHSEDHLSVLTLAAMKEDLAPGPHVVQALYWGIFGAAPQVLRRILTIQLFTVAP